jgi:phosphoadenosine phosphosulfate reductase
MHSFERPPARRAARLAQHYSDLSGPELLAAMIECEFPGRIALASAFGSESAVLLHMLAAIDPGTPVVFLDTGRLFGETLRYRDALTRRLGLTDLRVVQPDAARLQAQDPDGLLFRSDPDLCCRLRKAAPLDRALDGFDAWITGRKAFHGGRRRELPTIEAFGRHIKINPIAGWQKVEVEAYFAAHGLPHHPLEADGFTSIGCLPCTERVASGEDVRAGRWKGSAKTECGIHLATLEIVGAGA